ncbi:MAG: hypothetical protein GXO19_02285 [Epsilonproteobacteria bacterium]|nr:hypothetical protein [Campylobacterota bacterium]NPA56546.1 hypothetical protein [Campylobacterota bacterium]
MRRADREELLEAYREYEESRQKIGFRELLLVTLIVAVILALFLPKVYLANEIYYTSRKINKLLDQYEILREENRLLKQRLEQQRFKNQVLDTIF